METRLDHPNQLCGFESVSARFVFRWVWSILALWLVLLAVDWGARFRIFRWQDQWRVRKPSSSISSGGAVATVRTRQIPAQTGGGLTQLVPLHGIAARYAEYHPAYEEFMDGHGYPNAPLPEGRVWNIVMVGDSFMTSLGTQNVAQVLADISGLGVYNHGRAAAGPFLELPKFLNSGTFRPPPQVVIWNLTARELSASLFRRQPIDVWFGGEDVWRRHVEWRARGSVHWHLLAPAVFSQAWPNTSLVAYFARKAWGKMKLGIFGAWPQDVLGAEDPDFGPMLFYRENLRVLPRLTPTENAPAIVRVVSKVAAGFRARGVTLVVLLVPEKEQIHARALPPSDQRALAHGDDLLAGIQTGLEAAGTPVVNLMPVFQEATANGQRLYWRDDTHWNDAGIRLAAEELWRKVEPLLQ